MKKTIVTLLAASLVACGGGGGESTSVSTESKVVKPVDVMPIGLWKGHLINNGVSFDIVGMIAPSGEARFIESDGEQSRFKFKLDGDNNTASGIVYDVDGTFVTDIELSGSYTPTAITGTAKDGNVVTSTFSLTLNDESKDGASLSTVTGNYVNYDQSASIAIDADGVLSGSDDEGCVYNGSVKIPESSVNIYTLAIDVSSCAKFDGSYTGLATYAQIFDDSPEVGFIFQIDNGNYLVTDVLMK